MIISSPPNEHGWKLDMAQITQVRLVDDLDGGAAAESVSFSLDGKYYEIDLNEKHAAALREAFAPFVTGARRAGGSAVASRPRCRRAQLGRGRRLRRSVSGPTPTVSRCRHVVVSRPRSSKPTKTVEGRLSRLLLLPSPSSKRLSRLRRSRSVGRARRRPAKADRACAVGLGPGSDLGSGPSVLSRHVAIGPPLWAPSGGPAPHMSRRAQRSNEIVAGKDVERWVI